MVDAVSLLQLEGGDCNFHIAPHESDLKRIFGGQTVAQSLFAAAQSVPEDYVAHSLHGYFLTAGRTNAPLYFHVTELRNGRSFVTRQVDTLQNGHIIFTMQASFTDSKVPGLQHSTQVVFPGEPSDFKSVREVIPETNPGYQYVLEWENWDLRLVPSQQVTRTGYPAQLQLWVRYTGQTPLSLREKQSLLAYMSDMTLISTIREPHPNVAVQDASLDHSIWFFDDYDPSEWHFYDLVSPWASYGRGLGIGRVFNANGVLVAHTSQEGLVRYYS